MSPLLHQRKLRLAAAGAAVVLLLVTSLAAVAADGLRAGVDPGDHVIFDVTVRSENGTVLYTSNKHLALAELAAGNPHLDHPDDAHAGAYEPREGFLRLATPADDASFDHVPFLLGRHAGDTVVTPLVDSPFQRFPSTELPRFIEGVRASFNVTRDELNEYVEASNGTASRFTYAGEFPATAQWLNETHARVRVDLEPGAVVNSSTFGFAFQVVSADADELVLQPLLDVGQVFTTRPCGLSLGLEPGRYRVEALNDTTVVLASHTAQDRLADQRLSFEFTLLSVNDWPELLRAEALASQKLHAVGSWLAAATSFD